MYDTAPSFENLPAAERRAAIWREKENQEERLRHQQRLFSEVQDLLDRTRLDLSIILGPPVGECGTAARQVRDAADQIGLLARQFDEDSSETLKAGRRRLRDLEDQAQ